MPTILTNGIQLPDKGSVDWYSSMQSNYNLIDTHLGNTDIHVTAEDKANWDSKQGSLSQSQLDAISQVATNTDDIATLQTSKANTSHTHSSSDITDIGDYATKQYVDNSISGLVDNAPDALNTLNELSAALNDDSNFASTVTNALASKANSTDLASVATSGSYNDLSDKPTINDSTITIQKNGSTVDTFTTNGSDKTINITVPTKTSDITNDSNFVVSSNLATVATSGDYDDLTDLPTYGITRFCSSAITDNSSVAFSAISSTNKIKVGDFLLDTAGKLYQISAVDTANETVSVTTPLTQLAVDSSVMHLSGNETASGVKTFSSVIGLTGYPSIRMYLNDDEWNVQPATVKQSEIRFTDKNSVLVSYLTFQHRPDNIEPFRTCWRQQKMDGTSNYFSINFNNLGDFYPESNNVINLGTSSRKWKDVNTNKINGLDPDALSLPSDRNSRIDISGYFTNTGTGQSNSYTVPANGYIYLTLSELTNIHCFSRTSGNVTNYAQTFTKPSNSTGTLYVLFPVRKNDVFVTTWYTTTSVSVDGAYFIPCQGNV